MTNVSAAFGAYENAKLATGSSRSIEADAFRKINRELVRTSRNREIDYPGFVTALSKNVGLWTILAADVAHIENTLPVELKAKLFGLSQFVRRHTQNLLLGKSKPEIEILLEINDNIAAGLCGRTREVA